VQSVRLDLLDIPAERGPKNRHDERSPFTVEQAQGGATERLTNSRLLSLNLTHGRLHSIRVLRVGDDTDTSLVKDRGAGSDEASNFGNNGTIAGVKWGPAVMPP
jgi:hypothetical protein